MPIGQCVGRSRPGQGAYELICFGARHFTLSQQWEVNCDGLASHQGGIATPSRFQLVLGVLVVESNALFTLFTPLPPLPSLPPLPNLPPFPSLPSLPSLPFYLYLYLYLTLSYLTLVFGCYCCFLVVLLPVSLCCQESEFC